jgi:uncharacterized protein with GYD domain
MAVGFVLVKVDMGSERAVFDGLAKVDAVKELFPLFGEYDFIARVEAPDFDALGQVLVSEIRTIGGVLATKTLTATKFF